ncbi:MAG: cellulase family glycosylhydrolase [Bacteroidia bacterium]|nr:cellulase family glycosylhydrolase [Bacteroidia bacterium]
MSPSVSRRDFLKSGATAAALLATGPTSLQSWSRPDEPRRIRVALFLDTTFPSIDVEAPDGEALRSALSPFDLRVITSVDPSALPDPGDIDVLVTPYGSAFPEEAAELLLGYLYQGGCWVNLGGTPLAVPVRWDGKKWQPAQRRTVWHRRLGITQSMEVPANTVDRLQGNPAFDGMDAVAGAMRPALSRSFSLRLTATKHFSNEDGSDGTRDAEVHPLVTGFDGNMIPVSAPVVLIDRLHGAMAGSRQIFFTGNTALPGEAVRELVSVAACGAARLSVHPVHARIDTGERIEALLRLRRPLRAGSAPCTVELLQDGTPLERVDVDLRVSPALPDAQQRVVFRHAGAKQGLFEMRATWSFPCAGGALATTSAHTGVVVADPKDFVVGKRIAANGNELTLDGKPFTAAGTSYMAGDVQRSFLLEPNPLQWDEDLRAMKDAGVNIIRTGIWTGWKRMMLQPGMVDESVLRAAEAFLLTAARHDIPVIFTFFAFLPEAWGGLNPYLDPRAVDAQRAFIAAFVGRCNSMPGVIWDLINEPSFCSPAQLWKCRPNYDDFEKQAWQEWLHARYGDGSGAEYQRKLGDLWRSDTSEYGALPPLSAFDDAHLFHERGQLKVLDYRLFAQDAFNGWVRRMRDAIREAGGAAQLVTVGQDEGGTMDRPNPQFHVGEVDLSSVHSWWFNDDLLWDSVVTRAPGKPHLVQETGVMMYEQEDGSAWRSETDAAALLRRKLVIALTAGSVGYVQWLWHSNPWMASDNEAAIGALRSDGSAKPEYFELREIGHFVKRHQSLFTRRKEEDVVLILPHSQQFSARSFAVEATRACVRAMAYGCRMPLRAVSEYTLNETALAGAELLVLPSAGKLNEVAWQKVLTAVRAGATLLVTGVIDRDEHQREQLRSAQWKLSARQRPVHQSEILEIDGDPVPVAFRGEKIQRILTAEVEGERYAVLHRSKLGKGELLWCPLPVEIGDTPVAVTALYREALRLARLRPPVQLDPDTPDVLVTVSEYANATLLGVINEGSDMKEFELRFRGGSAIDVEIAAGQSQLLLLDGRGRRVEME